MELQVKVHAPTESKEVVERIAQLNLDKKINSYLVKLDRKDSQWVLEVFVEKNKKSLFNAKLQINIDGKSFRYEREDYKNLDDLVNHLFDHFKEELADK